MRRAGLPQLLALQPLLLGAVLTQPGSALATASPPCTTSTPQPCPNHPGHTFCESSAAPNQCDGPPPAHCPPCSHPSPPRGPPPPEELQTTYLALDTRNIQDSGGATLVLGPTKKTHSALIAEQERWEMRFDNMQPNVWHDPAVGKWRAWYNTFSSCELHNGTLFRAGPNHDPGAPIDCQALSSGCPGKKGDPAYPKSSDPHIHHTRGGVFCYAESDEATPSKPFTKPNLGLVEWPVGSGSKANNIIFDFGNDSSMGGLGAGITLDDSSPSANVSKFKLFGESMGPGTGRKLLLSESNDGVTFNNTHNVSINHGRWDTHKNVVWDPVTRRWVGYVRCDPSGGLRVQCWIESLTEDYTTTGWTDPRPTGLNTTGNYQPDALVAFRYEGVWLGFANVFNPTAYYSGRGAPTAGMWNPGAAPPGQVFGVLAVSHDARTWEYIHPDTSFIPHGEEGSFDCCGVFMAKQNPSMTPAYSSGSDTLPLFYNGCNGAFFGPRACAVGSVSIGRHAFAGLAGPATVLSSWAIVNNGTIRVTGAKIGSCSCLGRFGGFR
jgi:hypothetical protein